MSKIGIHKIGFKEINEVTDQWSQQQEGQQQEERAIPEMQLQGTHWFKSIDQTNTTLIENLVEDDSGMYYEVQLPFVVRKDVDIKLAKKYEGRPVVIYVDAVDGNRYTIGSKEYPTYLITSNRYSAMDTREVAFEVNYKSSTSLLR